MLLKRLQHIEKLFPTKRIVLHDCAPWISRHHLGGRFTQPTRASQLFEIYLPRWIVAFKSVLESVVTKISRRKTANRFTTTARSILVDPALLIEDQTARSFLADFVASGGELFLFGHGVLLHPDLSRLDTVHFANTTVFHFCRSDPIGDLTYLKPKFVSIIDCAPRITLVGEMEQDNKRILILLRKPNSHPRSRYRHEYFLKCVDQLINASQKPTTFVILVHPNTSLAWARRETKSLRHHRRKSSVKFRLERFSAESIEGVEYAVTYGSNLTMELAAAGILVFQVGPDCKTADDKREAFAFWTKNGLALEVDSGAKIAEHLSSSSLSTWIVTAQTNALRLFGDKIP